MELNLKLEQAHWWEELGLQGFLGWCLFTGGWTWSQYLCLGSWGLVHWCVGPCFGPSGGHNHVQRKLWGPQGSYGSLFTGELAVSMPSYFLDLRCPALAPADFQARVGLSHVAIKLEGKFQNGVYQHKHPCSRRRYQNGCH